MVSVTLFSYSGACSRVTMTALEEAALVQTVQWTDITTNAQYAPDYLALNRKAKVPTLMVGEATLTENAAILHYLHCTYPDARLLPQTGDAVQDAQGLSDLVWCGGMLHPMVRQIHAPQKWTKGSDEQTAGIRADGLEKLAKEWPISTRGLRKRRGGTVPTGRLLIPISIGLSARRPNQVFPPTTTLQLPIIRYGCANAPRFNGCWHAKLPG